MNKMAKFWGVLLVVKLFGVSCLDCDLVDEWLAILLTFLSLTINFFSLSSISSGRGLKWTSKFDLKNAILVWLAGCATQMQTYSGSGNPWDPTLIYFHF